MPSRLLDPRTGIIRRVERRALPAHLPEGLHHVTASIADTTRFTPWPSDPVGAGCAWWDAQAARDAAIGEAVERYCGNLVPSGLRRGAYRELVVAGHAALDPDALALFSPAQYRAPGFPFVPLTRDLPVRWVEGRDLATGEPVLAPASLVYGTYFRGAPTQAEPVTNPITYAGIAAHPCRERAEHAALMELLERDAVTVAWMRGTLLPRVRLPEPFPALFRGPAGVLATALYQFPSDLGVPVLGAVVHDTVTGVLTMGTACRPDPVEAALKAVAEAAVLHLMAAQLDDPDSPLMRQAAQAAGSPLAPWRADRRYRLSYRDDWRDVRDLACQLQLYLDPSMRPLLDERLAGGPRVDLDRVRAAGGPLGSAADVARLLRRHGLRAVAVDVTTSDVRSLGWHAIRVVVPGLYGNSPAAFPFLGGSRLAGAPCLLPLPYA